MNVKNKILIKISAMKSALVLLTIVQLVGLISSAATTAFWCDAKQKSQKMDYDVPAFKSLKINSVMATEDGQRAKSIQFKESEGGGFSISSDDLKASDSLSIKFETESGLQIWVNRFSDQSIRMILPKSNIIMYGTNYLGLSGMLDSTSDVILNCKSEQ